jgi:hypothetical protein
VTKLNLEKGEFRHSWRQVLPGSRAVLFTTEYAGRSTDEADTEVVSLKTGKRTLLHHGGFFARYLPSGHLIWIFHGVLYAASFDLDRLGLTGQPRPVIEDFSTRGMSARNSAFHRTGSSCTSVRRGSFSAPYFG